MQSVSPVHSFDIRHTGNGAVDIDAELYKNVALRHFSVWQVLLAITISLLALLATFYQLYLQRVHNAKSLKPLGQIFFDDRDELISVRLHNHGLGPLIVNRLTFVTDSADHFRIRDCIDLDPRSYMHVSMDDLSERVILPDSYLTIFEKQPDHSQQADHIRRQLTPLTLKVSGRDIYDRNVTIERNFKWFARHFKSDIPKLRA